MSKWSDPKWIREEVKRKWDSGRILGAVLESMPAFILEQEQKQEQEQEKDKYISSSVIFPMRIALIKPHRNEINVNFNKVSEWAELLRSNSKQAIGYGYELLEKEMAHSLLGRNRLPSHAVIPSIDDAVMMIKKRSDVDKFVSLTHTILSEWPIISVWIKSHPLKILKYADDWAGILKVLHWFSRNPACGLYIRQLDIPGVDTKFIENKTGILSELMDIVLPKDTIDYNYSAGADFELRYGLKKKPSRVRLRILSHELYISGLSDLSIPSEQLAELRIDISRVFITENEINGLCFPNMPKSIVIFGLGFGAEILKTVYWLRGVDVYYWGDIDTHGFAILDMVRGFLPQIKSFLMDKKTLLMYRHLWVQETKKYTGQLMRLSADEHQLYSSLQDDVWGVGVRLEQERIPYKNVQHEIHCISS